MTDRDGCIANINAAGRRRRLVTGVLVLVATAAAHMLLTHHDAGEWRHAALAPPLLFGWLCIVQAMEDTCVVLAAKGARETAAGTERIDDAALVAALRVRARLVWLRAAIATAGTVALFWVAS